MRSGRHDSGGCTHHEPTRAQTWTCGTATEHDVVPWLGDEDQWGAAVHMWNHNSNVLAGSRSAVRCDKEELKHHLYTACGTLETAIDTPLNVETLQAFRTQGPPLDHTSSQDPRPLLAHNRSCLKGDSSSAGTPYTADPAAGTPVFGWHDLPPQ